jgi:Ran GTPase-activating protein (RanGAP) involved in mRNA processing and transport
MNFSLYSNRITRDGAKYLSDFLKRDTPLKVLDLSYNRLEDDGAKIIAEALHFTNNTLEKLSIRYNNVRGEGLCAIADSLNYNRTLTHVFVWGNHLEENACIVKIIFYFVLKIFGI